MSDTTQYPDAEMKNWQGRSRCNSNRICLTVSTQSLFLASYPLSRCRKTPMWFTKTQQYGSSISPCRNMPEPPLTHAHVSPVQVAYFKKENWHLMCNLFGRKTCAVCQSTTDTVSSEYLLKDWKNQYDRELKDIELRTSVHRYRGVRPTHCLLQTYSRTMLDRNRKNEVLNELTRAVSMAQISGMSSLPQDSGAWGMLSLQQLLPISNGLVAQWGQSPTDLTCDTAMYHMHYFRELLYCGLSSPHPSDIQHSTCQQPKNIGPHSQHQFPQLTE